MHCILRRAYAEWCVVVLITLVNSLMLLRLLLVVLFCLSVVCYSLLSSAGYLSTKGSLAFTMTMISPKF